MTLGYQTTLSCTLSCCNTCSLEARRRLACDILGLYGSRKVISYSVTERRPWVRNAHSFLGFLKHDSLFFPCSFVLGSLLTFYFLLTSVVTICPLFFQEWPCHCSLIPLMLRASKTLLDFPLISVHRVTVETQPASVCVSESSQTASCSVSAIVC